MANQEKINELIEKRAKARLGGGEKRIDSQHAKGKHIQPDIILYKFITVKKYYTTKLGIPRKK